MKPLIQSLCEQFAIPVNRNLKEACLQALVIVEKSAGSGAHGAEISLEASAATAGPREIQSLTNALSTFVENHPGHPDVGSAVWVLGKTFDPQFAALYERVSTESEVYDSWAIRQAQIALENLSFQ